MQYLYYYCIAFVFFWIGWLSASMIIKSREEDIRAEILGNVGPTTERKYSESGILDSHPPADAVTEEIILETKPTDRKPAVKIRGTRKVKS